MKLNKLSENFENFLSWDKKEIEENKHEINELMQKLREKKKLYEKKIKKAENKEEKNELERKVKAVKKLIKKAKKNLY